MKIFHLPFFLFIIFVILVFSCEKAKEEIPAAQSTCNFQEYSGQNNCIQSVAVGVGKCCPLNEIYYCYEKNKCFASCDSAEKYCSGVVVKGTTSAGTGTGGGNSGCKYETYSGSQICESTSEVAVANGVCCLRSFPYYCSTTGKCYSSCEAAAAPCKSAVVKGR